MKLVSKRRRTCLILAVLVLPSAAAFAQELKKSIANSPEGFDQQYKEVFRAYKDGHTQKMESYLDEFALPSRWFTDTFGPENGQMLEKQYSAEFAEFKDREKGRFQFIETLKARFPIAPTAPTFVETNLPPWPDDRPIINSPPVLRQPLPPKQRFEIRGMVVNGHSYKELVSWMNSFMYVDGKFRFLGGGDAPFWDSLRDPCGTPEERTAVHLKKVIKPVYPEPAREAKIKGRVSLRVTIAQDGSVKNVEIIDGHPFLMDAAVDAVRQWQYEPFMNCGQPMEIRLLVRLDFPPK